MFLINKPIIYTNVSNFKKIYVVNIKVLKILATITHTDVGPTYIILITKIKWTRLKMNSQLLFCF